MNVTTDEGFKTLTVCKLDIKPAAVAFNTAECIKLAFVSLIIDRAEMSPVDLKTISWTGFDPHISAWGILNITDSSYIFLENGFAARVSKGLYALPNDNGTGTRPLFQQFPDYRLKGIQFAGPRFSNGRFRKRIIEIFPDGLTANMESTRNLTV
jgi:hypothetical protein